MWCRSTNPSPLEKKNQKTNKPVLIKLVDQMKINYSIIIRVYITWMVNFLQVETNKNDLISKQCPSSILQVIWSRSPRVRGICHSCHVLIIASLHVLPPVPSKFKHYENIPVKSSESPWFYRIFEFQRSDRTVWFMQVEFFSSQWRFSRSLILQILPKWKVSIVKRSDSPERRFNDREAC